MHIIFEEHRYEVDAVREVLHGISELQDVDKMVSVSYVGYYFEPAIKDCIFILPKVLLNEKDQLVIDENHTIDPALIITPQGQELYLTKEYRKFIYEFAVWIYRTIAVFHQHNAQSKAIYYRRLPQLGAGSRHKANTYLDIILSLIRFNQENQNFFLYTIRNVHSGYNKINWTRTISNSQAHLQDNVPLYLNPVNKKRQVNFDEELFVIFFSILNYINDEYGFRTPITLGYELLTKAQFAIYCKGYGRTRLRQIRYKYFSDKSLLLWDLCYAFFDSNYQLTINTDNKEYLLAKKYNIIFEAMIDELVGDSRDKLPDELKDQDDGKRVDHLYRYQGLTNNQDEDRSVYYIGDSKYYKRYTQLSKEAVYKQYTYARNVIQWNLNLFLNDKKEEQKRYNVRQLRDDITEGYDITPNFFISAIVNDELDYKEQLTPTDKRNQTYNSRQFKNRLFDRDTLLLAHYDVNFLHIVSLYARNNRSQQAVWKSKVRKEFRRQIQSMLEEQYNFYAITARAGVNSEQFLKENFQQLLGKVFSPYDNTDGQQFYSLALDQAPEFEQENELVLALLEPFFHVAECRLGTDPAEVLPKVEQVSVATVPPSLLTLHYVQRYPNDNFLIGCYNSQDQLDWILGKNDRGTNLYNVRLQTKDKHRNGAFTNNFLRKLNVKFVILYKFGEDHLNEYRVFHVNHFATMTEERMSKALYPNPQGNYFCFVFDEEVQLSPKPNIAKMLTTVRLSTTEQYNEGMPIIKTGEELLTVL